MAHLALTINLGGVVIAMDRYKDLVVSGTSQKSNAPDGANTFRYIKLQDKQFQLPTNGFSLYRSFEPCNQVTWSKLWNAFTETQIISFTFSVMAGAGQPALLTLSAEKVHIIRWGLRTCRLHELINDQVNLVGALFNADAYPHQEPDLTRRVFEYIEVSPEHLVMVQPDQQNQVPQASAN